MDWQVFIILGLMTGYGQALFFAGLCFAVYWRWFK